MRTLISFMIIVSVSSTLSLTSSQDAQATLVQTMLVGHGGNNGPGTSNTQTPQEKLTQCVKDAKQGEIDSAFENARAAKHLQPANPLYSVQYIDTLARISSAADEDTKPVIYREAITTIDQLKIEGSYNGSNNPESAYHFMTVTGKLADELMPTEEAQAVELKLAQATIARNLSSNPMYPANAKEILGDGLISGAQAHAIKGELQPTLDAITQACKLGYCNFDQLAKDEFLTRLDDQVALKSHVEKLHRRYLVNVKHWARKAISEFQAFEFEFELKDVKGRSVANHDFHNQVLVIDLWATWCVPCLEGIPHFIELQKKFDRQNVQVLGISMDSPDDPDSSVEKVVQFMEAAGFNYPCVMGFAGLTQQVPGGDVKYPTTLFVDRAGNVRFVAAGYHDFAKLAALTEVLANEEEPVTTSPIH